MAYRPFAKPCTPIQLCDFLLGDYRHPAVYLLHDEGEVVYVGQTRTLKWRIETHLREGLKDFDAVSFIPCCVSKLMTIETHYIREISPIYNQCAVAKSVAFERQLVLEDIPLRDVGGDLHVGSLGLSRMMSCSRPFAKQLISMTGKASVSLSEAFEIAATVREPA